MRIYPSLWLLRAIPRNLVSRLMGKVAAWRWPKSWRPRLWRAFGGFFGVDFAEIREPLDSFAALQDFFVRRLREGARPVDETPNILVSPCDGAWGAAGRVGEGRLLQVKGRPYGVGELLGIDEAEARRYEGGFFATLYLSPKDYHRFHTPCRVELPAATYLPGSLWPVNRAGVEGIARLFAVNERVVAFFDVAEPGYRGRLALVAVGATMVGKVKVTFDDLETNRPGIGRQERSYRPAKTFAKAEEWGRFEFGSTLVLVAEPGALELDIGEPGTPVRLGRPVGRLLARG